MGKCEREEDRFAFVQLRFEVPDRLPSGCEFGDTGHHWESQEGLEKNHSDNVCVCFCGSLRSCGCQERNSLQLARKSGELLGYRELHRVCCSPGSYEDGNSSSGLCRTMWPPATRTFPYTARPSVLMREASSLHICPLQS